MQSNVELIEHTRTGHAAIDMMAFRNRPQVDIHLHEPSGILLYRMTNYGEVGSMTFVSRDEHQPDLLFVSRGAGVTASGRIGGAPVQVAANRLLRTTFIPNGCDMELRFGAAARSTNLLFPVGYLDHLMTPDMSGPASPVLYSNDDRLPQLVKLLEQEILFPGFASDLLVESLMRSIVALLKQCRLHADAATSGRVYMSPVRLKRVFDHVESHLNQPIHLAELAGIAGLSVFHFCRTFKCATGVSPYHYVSQRRLERGRELLTNSKLPIADLALACGFSNQSHFTAAFSKELGISPARYRREARR